MKGIVQEPFNKIEEQTINRVILNSLLIFSIQRDN
jgi:hypothetical protein